MKNKIQAILSTIVARFESGDIPEAVAYSMFPVADIPSAKWSLVKTIFDKTFFYSVNLSHTNLQNRRDHLVI